MSFAKMRPTLLIMLGSQAAAFSDLTAGKTVCDAIKICQLDGSTMCPQGMEYVAPPQRTSSYTIEAEGGATYVPGELITLHLRVASPTIQGKRNAGALQCRCTGKCGPYCDCGKAATAKCTPTTTPFMESSKYIGLMMYAVRADDPTEAKVGTFEIPREASPRFALMGGEGCDGRTLVQRSALPKRFHERFWFRAPPAGTGAIVFRVLIKQGATLGGAFYWPTAPSAGTAAPPQDGVSGGDLALNEIAAPATPAVVWVRGSEGQPCDSVCALRGASCDATEFTAAASSTGLLSVISSQQLCVRPLLGSCDAFAPAMSGLRDGWCWFVDTKGCAPPAASQCAATPPGKETGLRLCPCRSTGGRRALSSDAPASLLIQETRGEEPRRQIKPLPAGHIDIGTRSTNRSASGCPFASLATTYDAGDAPVTGDFLSNDASDAADAADATHAPTLKRKLSQLQAALINRVATPMLGLALAIATAALALRARRLPRGVTAAAGLLSTLEGAAAHNWINSPRSRASKASTTAPCLQRTDPRPGVRVNPDQEFLVEWASGHPGSYHFFVVLNAADETKMAMHTETMLNDYLDNAPVGAPAYKEGVRYRKRHYGWSAKSAKGGDEPTLNNFLQEGLTPVGAGDPNYVERPAAFACSNYGSAPGTDAKTGVCTQVSDLTLYDYPEAGHADDKRASYVSPTYPWIEAVYRFKSVKPTPNKNGYPKQFDTARFFVPARAAAGQYIIQYLWRGYRDCIDVDVLAATAPVPPTSAAMYGATAADGATPTTIMVKTDHCQFPAGGYQPFTRTVAGVGACVAIPPPGTTNAAGQTRTDAQEACVARCRDALNRRCSAINIVPAEAPTATRIWGTDSTATNVPWGNGGCGTTQAAFVAAEPAGSSVCYGFTPGAEPIVGEPWTVVDDDPEDETFYSTCYRKLTSFTFADGGNPLVAGPTPPVPWRYGDYCIACGDVTTAPLTGHWKLADTCTMCSREALPPCRNETQCHLGGNDVVQPGPGVGDPSEDLVGDGDGMGGDDDAGGDALTGADGSPKPPLYAIIGAGVVLGSLLLAFLCCCCWRRRRARASKRVPPPSKELFGNVAELSAVATPAIAQRGAPPPPPEEPPLPSGWEAFADEDSGKTYYFHKESGRTQWHLPQDGEEEVSKI